MANKIVNKKSRETVSNIKLSNYLQNKSIRGEQVPYMTTICDETGISHATISRFAKKRGFYNFADLRANYNKNLQREKDENLDLGLLNFLRSNNSFVIATSRSTALVGYHIRERLLSLGFVVKMLPFKSEYPIDGIFDITEGDSIIAVSLSADSMRVQDIIIKNTDKKIFLITTDNLDSNNANLTVASLPEFKYLKRESYEMYKSIKKINDWLNDVINIIHVETINNYNTKK